MSKLKADQKTIENFMGERKNFFLIPDYQRPYAWEDDECSTLWNDIFTFCFPDGDSRSFDENDEYFLGSLVVFRNENNRLEVIDGQQRLVTLTLLLRAFYQAYGDNMTDEDSHDAKRDIAKCLWKTQSIGHQLDMSDLKIYSEVANEKDNNEFLHIMIEGEADKNQYKGRYAENYRLFQRKIKEFQENFPKYFHLMPERILANCSMLPIEAEGQDTALRIFATLNDRGKPLSDSDILKAKLYKVYSDNQQKDFFISRWRTFESSCKTIFVPGRSNPLDDMFTRYMFYAKASQGSIDTSVEGLRDFYTRDDKKYSPLKRDYTKTFDNLLILADFWRDVTLQERERFSEKILKSLYVLHYMPNNFWTFLVSVYFMTNKNKNGMLEEKNFYDFLQKITGFMLASKIMRPGNTTPFFHAMADTACGRKITFRGYEFDLVELESRLMNFDFNDSRKITRGFIAWYVFQDKEQELLSLETKYDTEHIFPRKRKDELRNEKNFDALGNKSLLEKNINIRASDYRFTDKANYYLGRTFTKKQPTKVHELQELARTKNDFTEQDIVQRNKKIIGSFIKFMGYYDMLK